MKLTIDSAETLEDTLRVVGALYNVTLEVSERQADNTGSGDSNGQPASTGSNATVTRAKARTSKARTSKKRNPRKPRQARPTANGHGRVSTGAVRVWARENGYEIADRGRVPATVLTAYQQAHNN